MPDSHPLAELLAGPPEEAAPRLLGCVLTSRIGGALVEARVTEVEAYKGEDDPASHAYRGRTARNQSMFRQPGTLYVYRSYGVHWCANVAAGPEGTGWGILFRGAEIEGGARIAEGRRGRSDGLSNGPGKLCQALGIDGSHDGTYLLDEASPITIRPGEPPDLVMATPRIGISRARERPWRFVAASTMSA